MLSISNHLLTREFSIRFLGIYIDSHLNWVSHINYIAKKFLFTILEGFFFFTSKKKYIYIYIPITKGFLLELLYNALPKTRTNYGIFNIWYQGVKVWTDISDDMKLLPLKHF